MPSNVQFLDKSTGEPVILEDVDSAVCRHLGVDPHPAEWHENWFNVVGLLMAMGYRGVELRDKIWDFFADEPARGATLVEIDKFLEETYDVRSWTNIGRFR